MLSSGQWLALYSLVVYVLLHVHKLWTPIFLTCLFSYHRCWSGLPTMKSLIRQLHQVRKQLLVSIHKCAMISVWRLSSLLWIFSIIYIYIIFLYYILVIGCLFLLCCSISQLCRKASLVYLCCLRLLTSQTLWCQLTRRHTLRPYSLLSISPLRSSSSWIWYVSVCT